MSCLGSDIDVCHESNRKAAAAEDTTVAPGCLQWTIPSLRLYKAWTVNSRD